MNRSVPTPKDMFNGKWPLSFDDYSEDDKDKFLYEATKAYQRLINIQFSLSYHAHISISDLDNMPPYEYLEFYSELKKQKEAEKKSMEEAASKKPTIGG